MWEGPRARPFIVRPTSRSFACIDSATHQQHSSSQSRCFRRKPVLDEAAREIIVSAFAFAVQQQRIYLRAFVVMPDHWHALFALREPWTLPKFMHHMMSYVGGKTSALLIHFENIMARQLLRHSRCMSDAPDWPMWDRVTTDFVYIRLHGHTRKYVSSYSKSALRKWATRAQCWLQENRDVHVYFDNDAEGAAPKNALTLLEMLR